MLEQRHAVLLECIMGDRNDLWYNNMSLQCLHVCILNAWLLHFLFGSGSC